MFPSRCSHREVLRVLSLFCAIAWVASADERLQAIVRERVELMHKASNLLGVDSLRESSPLYNFFSAISPERGRRAQKGIVFPAGNSKQLANAYIGARMVRELGCNLPIDIAVYGANERPDTYHSELLKVA